MTDVHSTDALLEEYLTVSMQAENEADMENPIESLQDDQGRIQGKGPGDDKIREEITSNPPPTIETEILDPRGDLIIENGPFRLLVSSSVLLLSCGYFKKMLREDGFIEGMD
jgi:hypothetical protein